MPCTRGCGGWRRRHSSGGPSTRRRACISIAFSTCLTAALPTSDGAGGKPETLLDDLPTLLDRQQQVNEAGGLVARYLTAAGPPQRLLAVLGRCLLREDRDFHTIQMMEAAFRQYALLGDTPAGPHVLVAAGRYLAAHAPTVRAQGQTYHIARRLHRGDRLFEEA